MTDSPNIHWTKTPGTAPAAGMKQAVMRWPGTYVTRTMRRHRFRWHWQLILDTGLRSHDRTLTGHAWRKTVAFRESERHARGKHRR